MTAKDDAKKDDAKAPPVDDRNVQAPDETENPDPSLAVNPNLPADEALAANPTLPTIDGGQLYRPLTTQEVDNAVQKVQNAIGWEAKRKLARSLLPQIAPLLDELFQAAPRSEG